jgi:hypothetical protein
LVSIHPSVLPKERLNRSLAGLHAALEARDLAGALTQLRSLVPEYSPSPALVARAQQCGVEVSL